MADVITRFKLETTQFDSKLRDTAKALKDVTHQASLGGKDFDNFSKEAIKSAQALGTVASGANNTKDKLRDLVGSYNDAAKAYNELTDKAKQGEFGKAMSQSLTQLQQRIKQTKDDLYSLGDAAGGGLGSKFTDMLSVTGGSLIAQGVTKLASELQDTVKQGVELARAGEGIRVAFDKLNNPGLLSNLREATHGTVTDIELMKAAVKFNDFKLPLEELGTMLAFAQQKAKDTGQSVDYMVDSIVTGLGRKSVMILDNLGLSAAQIKERMKEGGDMTKAVGDIIREEMAKAGDYVETAADRAARATVDAKNKMEELGRAAIPVAEEFDKAWNTIKIGGMSFLNTVLVPIANSIKYINELLNSTPQDVFEKAWGKAGGEVGSNVDDNGNYIKRPADGNWAGFDADKGVWKKGVTPRPLYNSATGQTEIPEITVQGHTPTKTTVSGGGGGNRQPINISFNADKAALAGEHGVDTMSSVWAMMGGDAGLRQMMGIGAQQFDIKRVLDEYVNDPDKEKREKANKTKDPMMELSKAINGLTSIRGGLEGMGIKLPAELEKGLNVLQGLMSIIQGVQAVISIFSTSTETANTIAVAANTVALGTLTAAVTANTATNFLPFAKGGVVHAANGYVSGTTYSGDQIPAMLNAGEVVLNRSQAGVLAASLQAVGQSGEGGGDGKPYVSGEMIWLGLTNYLNRSGRGEIVTSRRK